MRTAPDRSSPAAPPRHRGVPRAIFRGLVPGALVLVLLAGLPGGAGSRSLASPDTASGAVIPDGFVPEMTPFLEQFCVGCHGPEKSKGGLDLVDLLAHADANGLAADLVDWRTVREKLRHREMPPAAEEGDDFPRPDEGEVDGALRLLDTHLASAIAALPQEPGTVTTRRLNRTEAEASIRDLFGVHLEIERHLPPDDVGEGYDHIGDVLGLPPMLFERWMGLAEEVARRAVILPSEQRIPERRVEAELLLGRGGVRMVSKGYQYMFARSTVSTEQRLPASGTYEIGVVAFGTQAGSEVVKIAIEVDGERRAVFEVPETEGAAGTHTKQLALTSGVHEFGATFINDYYNPTHRDAKQRDRNAAVHAITIRGPLEGLEPTAFQRSVWAEEPAADAWRPALARALPDLLGRVWRRPVTPEESERFLDLVDAATPDDASASVHLRTAIVAMIVSPRFLFRLEGERDGEPGSVRPLDGYERATRLSYFLHGTTPSAALLAVAGAGELDTVEGVRRHATRMLREPGARALSERFVPQWLQFSHLPQHRPDDRVFREFDAVLARDLGRETVEFFDLIRREARPITDLVLADYTVVNGRVAEYYGLEGVEGDAFREVPVTIARGGGLLAQAGILTATSSPTRTSPVMRGKWILEALLDSAPPPPPPGAGTLPEPGQPGSLRPLREQLAAHRRDPICASCHVRMDALGFAMEEFDAVGRWRRRDPEAKIDAEGKLPDGRIVNGIADLRPVVAEDPGFPRAVARNLFVFALGRGLTIEDEPALERLIARLAAEPTIPALIDEIVGSRAFLERRVPRRAPQDGGGEKNDERF